MPTGYTSDIREGISFEKFALNCSRAFGALVMMRDEPIDAEIPDTFEPTSYHTERLAEEKERLKFLSLLTDEQKKEYSDKDYKDKWLLWEKREAEKTDLENKYKEMLAKVVKWKPPTKDHEGLKEFMISQIHESIKWDCHEPDKPVKQAAEKWYFLEVQKVEDNIKYHTEENEKEIQRQKERSEWVRQLKQSLNPSPTTK